MYETRSRAGASPAYDVLLDRNTVYFGLRIKSRLILTRKER